MAIIDPIVRRNDCYAVWVYVFLAQALTTRYPERWKRLGQFRTYFGGVLGPIFGFLAFMGLLHTALQAK
jgi:hypothetical protein